MDLIGSEMMTKTEGKEEKKRKKRKKKEITFFSSSVVHYEIYQGS
jgi:hypothetical protein